MSLLFPDEGLVYDYKLDDAGISLPAQEEDDEEEIRNKKVIVEKSFIQKYYIFPTFLTIV